MWDVDPELSHIDQTHWLTDGRRLGYAEFGDPEGTPIFFFHGGPGSRLTGELLAAAARAVGIRLIALDRPGFGLSSFQPGRSRAEWPSDVLELADVLDIDRFLTAGWSAGGPYALACAAAAPDRVRAAGVFAGVDRLHHLNPHMMRALWGLRGRSQGAELDSHQWSHTLARVWARTKKARPEMDRAEIATLATGIAEGLREGTAGIFHELRLLAGAWDFEPGTIRHVPVRFWHGLDDALISTRHTRAMTARVPGAQAIYLPDCGHVTLLTQCGREMLTELKRIAT